MLAEEGAGGEGEAAAEKGAWKEGEAAEAEEAVATLEEALEAVATVEEVVAPLPPRWRGPFVRWATQPKRRPPARGSIRAKLRANRTSVPRSLF